MRILIAGPESSGKTTLANYLAQEFDVPLVPECARTYLELYGPEYNASDLLKIAEENWSNYESAAPPVIFDTFLINIKIWSEFKYGKCHPWIEDKIVASHFDIIFLLKPDISWEFDPLRENENNRDKIFKDYLNVLNLYNFNFHIIEGSHARRIKDCLTILELHGFRK